MSSRRRSHLPRLACDASEAIEPRASTEHRRLSRQRLLNRAREHGEDFNYLLTRYANERMLYRLELP